MPLQTQNLVMIGLGIQGDSPPNGYQPPLVDGVHLRWAFKRDLGFPWYGFYLLRHLHQPGKPICLSPMLQGLAATPTGSNHLTTAAGEISSDQNLVLIDNFPPSGAPELDLAGRRYLRITLPKRYLPPVGRHHGFTPDRRLAANGERGLPDADQENEQHRSRYHCDHHCHSFMDRPI
jgi:hypothetical protein